ncbi:unnamed protein product [Heligmosomoides polygyrus]|uniref:Uncharacterized protein n=1 Tax=Heligmosomoides polygyrus TaxID=6339 RepID=A0A183FG95_HELPZ|nr:unnamed protein product [Heligmosomoides polygyrus]
MPAKRGSMSESIGRPYLLDADTAKPIRHLSEKSHAHLRRMRHSDIFSSPPSKPVVKIAKLTAMSRCQCVAE